MNDALGYIEDLIARDDGQRAYKPVYVPEGDCVTYYSDDTPCHAIRLSELATVYVSDSDPERLVGCQIKNVLKRLEGFGSFGVSISKGKTIKLGMLFMATGVLPDRSRLVHGFYQSPMAEEDVELPELCGAN